ncbi:E3 ubiquitin-protein ligase RBBP6-like isoform X2 [Euwallacea similis]|uniref:E3 ubiquitin-protein ligase RBBP6-like isoform X2 n=1 Tax=Euwallacea similis TaxID=1736056 RepID=UPI00344B1A6F
MSVHYRFKSALEYDTITFDGLHISVKDLKNAIIQQKRIGKSTDFDLRITNAQTGEIYEDENALIPKNTSLLIARIPVTAPKQKQWEGYGGNITPPSKIDESGTLSKATDLANLDAPEEDKIKAMMSQSTQDYDPSNYLKIRGANQVGPVPTTYRCYKCHQGGHWIKDCPLGQGVEPLEIKKTTGIPQSFLIPVEGPQVPGAMMTSNGQYAVPALDLQAYTQKQASAPVQQLKPEIPEDLLCSICSDLLADAVMIPCCGNSFCDECIRSMLLESEDHECPDCHEKDISPATLIPNRFLRKSVNNFKNTTGYEKKPIFKPKISIEEPGKKDSTSLPEVDSTAKDSLISEEKTVISEADSTESGKIGHDLTKEPLVDIVKNAEPEGPPGVSPRQSPVHKISSKVTRSGDRDRTSRDRGHHGGKRGSPKHHRSRSPSPRKSRTRHSPNYERRIRSPETPTRDDVPPGMGTNYPIPPPRPMPGIPLGDVLQGGPGNGMPPGAPPMQGPPPGMPPGAYAHGQPPPFIPPGAPPNYRLPPPGAQPPPYMPPGPGQYAPRPAFDPMNGPPGNFGPSFPGRPREFGGRRNGRDRTPPGVIDDPLAAFNRILREKDEKRARAQRMARRSWSRSRSRSFSRSPPPMRRRSRSPRRRMSRSRSRSFSLSRRRVDRVDFDREYDRGPFREKPRDRRGDSRDRFYDDRERDYERSSVRGRGPPPPGPMANPPPQWGPQRDPYYPEQPHPGYQNRYPQQILHIQSERKYEAIAPPGVEQPPIPGLESEFPPVNKVDKQRHTPPRQERDRHHSPREKEDRHRDRDREKRDRDRKKEVKRSRSKTPDPWRNPSPKSSGTPEKPKKRRSSIEPKEERKKDKDRHKDPSDEEKKKSKEKKRHKEKKEEKKKKKEKKDKHRHKSKDRSKKEEFKQVIPRQSVGTDEESEEVRKKIEERRKQKEEEERKKLEEERKKEERRLRFIEDEKRKREEETRKEEAKRKAIEEARKLLEAEEQARVEKHEKEQELEQQKEIEEHKMQEGIETENLKSIDLYDEVIPEKDLVREVRDDFSLFEKNREECPENDFLQEQLNNVEENTQSDEHAEFPKFGEEEDTGILELHSDMDIKLDESDILAPFPEKSKWEVDEDGQIQNSPSDTNKDFMDPSTKVSSEVLKRAENVIFARAINSIRPIEIKKVGGERVKVYADEKNPEKTKIEVPVEKPRLSIKERLGKKIDDPEPGVVLLDNRRSSSPFNRRDRRIAIEGHRRHDRRNRSRDRDRHRGHNDKSNDKGKRTKREEKEKHEERSREKRKRSRSRSENKELKKKKDRKSKKEKPKKFEEGKSEEKSEDMLKSAVDKRKSTLDEANFEPDYDLETHDDEASEKGSKKDKEARKGTTIEQDSSSSESSSSSSEEDRKRKRRKSKKKRKRKDSTCSDSDSSSDSSESDKDRKKKKHKKTKKKKKRSKHK